MATPDEATTDGYDTQMQTNHLSHFLLTKELYPLLEKQAAEFESSDDGVDAPRIVNHSSIGRDHTLNGGLERKYFKKNGGNLGGNSIGMMKGACFHRYFQTKLANSVFTYALHDKLRAKSSKVRAVCAHPGVSDTNLGTHMNLGWFVNAAMKLFTPLMVQTPEDGACGLMLGMMRPDAASGTLYGPKNSGYKGWPVPNPPKPYETDPEAIQMLWTTSEDAIGAKFDL